MLLSFGNTTKKPLNFLAAGMIVDKILQVDDKFDGITVIFNNFVNRVMFRTVNTNFDSLKSLVANPMPFNVFEWQDEGVIYQIRDLFEFQLATFIYNAAQENNAAELTSR
jgi:F0F1-type ATP synthase gamma subunit